MSHSQTDSAGENMVMEQKGSPKEPGEGVETDEVEERNGHCASETQNQRQTDGTQNSNSDESDGTQSSNSDESKSKCSLFFSLWRQSY